MTAKREARHTIRFPDDVVEWLEAEKKRLGLNKNTIVILAVRKMAGLDKKKEAG